MKVDFNALLTDLEGADLKDENGKAISLGAIARLALNAPTPDLAENSMRFDLMVNIGKGEIDLKAEEVALIKRSLPGRFPPLVVGQAALMLEGKSI